MITTIASALLAIVKAIPYVQKIFQQMNEMNYQRLIAQAEHTITTQEEKLHVISKQIESAQSDDDRRVLASLLNEQLRSRN